MGGWIIIAGCRRSGLSPAPSSGAGSSRANGLGPNSISPQKKAASPASTAVAHGTSSRCLVRVRKSTIDEAIESTQAQRSSEPPGDERGDQGEYETDGAESDHQPPGETVVTR